MEITILGRPISKKNSKQIGRNKWTGKTFFTSSKAYKNFQEIALWQLKSVKERFFGNLRITYTFHQKGKLFQDADNAIASINDVLQDAEIISDDKNIKKGYFEIINDCDDWKTVIKIEKLP